MPDRFRRAGRATTLQPRGATARGCRSVAGVPWHALSPDAAAYSKVRLWTMDPDRKIAMQIADAIGQMVHPYVKPISIGTSAYNALSVADSGSCFVLRVGSNLFGVTAVHLIRGIRRRQSEHPGPRRIFSTLAQSRCGARW